MPRPHVRSIALLPKVLQCFTSPDTLCLCVSRKRDTGALEGTPEPSPVDPPNVRSTPDALPSLRHSRRIEESVDLDVRRHDVGRDTQGIERWRERPENGAVLGEQ